MRRRRTKWVDRIGAVVAALLLLALAGCGDRGKQGTQVQWIEGTPPPEYLAQVNGGTIVPPTPVPPATTAPPPTQPIPTPTATASAPPVGTKLTDEQLQQFRPDELGLIPILEYHAFTTDPSQEAQFTRTIADFRSDLRWLYAHDFYVVPLRDVIQDTIRAPAGKHPVVLTFDDSSVGQFRYLIGADGAVTIDPGSAVGVMEAFYAAHPDFGRGGFFAVLPQPYFCFSWQLEERETDQDAYCGQKLRWLLHHGYEVGNHTLNHENLGDVPNARFLDEVGGAIEQIRRLAPGATADILAMPYGTYPDRKKHPAQVTWLRHGFTYHGSRYRILGCLMVGAEPAPSPASVDWDPLMIPRIQAGNAEEYGYTAFWFGRFAADPGFLYTSDGDPDTITVPRILSPTMEGTLNTQRVEADGKELIRYDQR